MSITLTNANKNTVAALTLPSKALTLTWDQATMTEDQATFTWDTPENVIVLTTKNSASLNLTTKP